MKIPTDTALKATESAERERLTHYVNALLPALERFDSFDGPDLAGPERPKMAKSAGPAVAGTPSRPAVRAERPAGDCYTKWFAPWRSWFCGLGRNSPHHCGRGCVPCGYCFGCSSLLGNGLQLSRDLSRCAGFANCLASIRGFKVCL
jgi:hypothetical protein